MLPQNRKHVNAGTLASSRPKNHLLPGLPHLSLSPLTLDFVTFILLHLKNPYYIYMSFLKILLHFLFYFLN